MDDVLIYKLKAAQEKQHLERVMRRYERYDLLIIDELGYLPISANEAKLLFQLINHLSIHNEDKMLMKENVRELKTMQTPLVSIIVPVYNGAETIEKCLRRIQHQT